MVDIQNTPPRLRYYFEPVLNCEMCGDPSDNHQILGQRLNKPQGFSPKKKSGISVSVMRCRNCGLIYPQPLPIPFDLQDHYGIPPEDYWQEDYFKWSPDDFAGQIKDAKEMLPFKEGMSSLDIGAGLGKAMLCLDAAGFNSFGFEPSKPFYERAISKMGIDKTKLKLGMVEEMEYPEAEFDFITFGAVVEHLYHPAQSLEKAMRWLKPGGIIHIEVPSSRYYVQTLYRKIMRLRGTNYVMNISPMHSPFHLYEFSVKSFEDLGKRLGYKIERHVIDVGFMPPAPGIIKAILNKYMKWTKTGMQLTIYLRKPN